MSRGEKLIPKTVRADAKTWARVSAVADAISAQPGAETLHDKLGPALRLILSHGLPAAEAAVGIIRSDPAALGRDAVRARKLVNNLAVWRADGRRLHMEAGLNPATDPHVLVLYGGHDILVGVEPRVTTFAEVQRTAIELLARLAGSREGLELRTIDGRKVNPNDTVSRAMAGTLILLLLSDKVVPDSEPEDEELEDTSTVELSRPHVDSNPTRMGAFEIPIVVYVEGVPLQGMAKSLDERMMELMARALIATDQEAPLLDWSICVRQSGHVVAPNVTIAEVLRREGTSQHPLELVLARNHEIFEFAIIVNGEEVHTVGFAGETLKEARGRALYLSNNTHRPPETWGAYSEAGVRMDMDKLLEELELQSVTRLHLSLPVGAGG